MWGENDNDVLCGFEDFLVQCQQTDAWTDKNLFLTCLPKEWLQKYILNWNTLIAVYIGQMLTLQR